jgi:hypoxanthine phosphoribosyltransferase
MAAAKRSRAATAKPPRRSAAKKPSTSAAGRPKAPPAARRRAAASAEPIDEFGAAGGAPNAPAQAAVDRSARASATKELGWSEFDRELQALARAVARRFKPEVVVGLAHGGLFVGEALATAVKQAFFPVHLVRRSRDRASHTPTGIAEEMPAVLKGKRVLVVDDIASSGDSLEFAVRLAKARGAKAVATATLVARPGRYVPDFAAFTTDTFFVFPWDYQSLVDEARFTPRG